MGYSNLNENLINDFSVKKYAHLQYASKSDILKVQTELFLEHLKFTTQNSPFYRNLYKDIDISAIKNISDIEKLPFTTKSDMVNTSQFLAVKDKDIVDICLTSATSSPTPTIISQTSSDLKRLAYNEELALNIAGITENDTMLICAAIDRCFMAGLAYFLGGVKLNTKVVRGGSGKPAQHWELIKLLNITVIIGVPSLLYKIGEYARENNEDPAKTSVKKLIAIGEPTKNKKLELLPVADELENMWDAKIYSTYASSELATTFCECEARNGGHMRPELNLIEILNDDGTPVNDGETGEVITTPIGITGMPLIRFKTGDISYVINDKCSCGRTTKRLGPIIGRKNQMLKYKGTTVFPDSIISALEGDPRFHLGYIEASLNNDKTDKIILFASLKEPSSSHQWIAEKLRAKIRVVPEIILVSKDETEKKVYQFDKKRKRMTFFDLR